MKKIIIIFMCVLLAAGCTNKKEKVPQKEEKKKEETIEKEEPPKYIDQNKTPIGIYKLSGNKLTKLETINTDLVVEQDIGTFQIYPSNQEIINLDKSFGQSFYDEWTKYNTDNTLKLGFNITFTLLNGTTINYNILNPSQTFDHWEHLMNYLYDDYANLGKGFYSHIENDEYNESTLFTAFKMQSSYQCDEINSGIILSAFTYDSEDDFLNGSYRGNSLSSLKICINGKPC